MDIESKRFRIRTHPSIPGQAQLSTRGDEPASHIVNLADVPSVHQLSVMTEAAFDRAMEALL